MRNIRTTFRSLLDRVTLRATVILPFGHETIAQAGQKMVGRVAALGN